MKKILATLLRHLAAVIDPPKPSETAQSPITDLDFVQSFDMAQEICRRNDLCILIYGKVQISEGCRWFDGKRSVKISEAENLPVFSAVLQTVLCEMGGVTLEAAY